MHISFYKKAFAVLKIYISLWNNKERNMKRKLSDLSKGDLFTIVREGNATEYKFKGKGLILRFEYTSQDTGIDTENNVDEVVILKDSKDVV